MALASVTFQFTVEKFPESKWEVQSFNLDEAISALYTLQVFTGPQLYIEAQDLLGESATLTLLRGESQRKVHGIITQFEKIETKDVQPTKMRLELSPALQALGQSQDARIFQGKTVPEIVMEVLKARLSAYGRDARERLMRVYGRREYCAQYNETDLQFVERLMQEEGIAYYFDHSGTRELLVLMDDNQAYTANGCLQLPMGVGYQIQEESVETLHKVQQSRANKVTVHKFDWTRPRPTTSETAKGDASSGPVRELYYAPNINFVGYSNAAYQCDNANQRARDVLAHEAMRAWTGTRGTSNVTRLGPGSVFTLFTDGKTRYLVLSVKHAGDGHQPTHGEGGEFVPYGNSFTCLPVDVQYRPVTTVHTRPAIGLQTATVVGPKGEEIWSDEHGRIKVQFHWDRAAQGDENSSCWVRVTQGWAGAGFGSVFVPRVGMEVIVGFLQGDPDQPLVLGCCYNGNNLAAYDPKDSKTRSAFRTRSSPHPPAGQAYNELSFEDALGAEEVLLRAQRDMKTEVMSAMDTVVWGSATTNVAKNRTTKIDGTEMLTVLGGRTQDISFQRTNITTHDSHTVGGNYTSETGGDSRHQVGKKRHVEVIGDHTRTLHADDTVSIAGEQKITIEGNHASTIGGTQKALVKKDVQIKCEGEHTSEVTKNATRKIGGNSILNVEQSREVSANVIKLDVKNTFIIRQGDATITLKSSGIQIKGVNVTIEGQSVHVKSPSRIALKSPKCTVG